MDEMNKMKTEIIIRFISFIPVNFFLKSLHLCSSVLKNYFNF